ncbi:unnamed protein product, partial [Laminaria digitata]
MDAQALLRINAQEDHFLPVEIKIGMLMEQAAMRMRASAMVGERISKLDDVIRVRALLAIIREKIGATEGQQQPEAATTTSSSRSSSISSNSREELGEISPDSKEGDCSQDPAPPEAEEATSSATASDRCSVPSEEDLAMFTRMAVSSTKVVLFQLAQEGEAEGAKDVFDVYEGLLTTSALSKAAAEGFPSMNVDSLMSPRHSCYRRLIAARHRFLLRKLGVLLDMKEDLDTLLGLAVDVEVLGDSLADVDLSSPEDEELAAKELLQAGKAGGAGGAAEPSSRSGAAAAAGAPISTVSSRSGASSAEGVMSTLRNTTWDKDLAGEDTTEV